jgi:LPS O-antigen subunit length determinant protein (WzzB/FepE family)
MNMRDIFLQLIATDPTRLKIETAKRPDIFKPNKKIDQKQAHRKKLRSTNTKVEQTQAHRGKPRPIVEL